MRPEEFRLRDIILACRSANDFVSELTHEQFDVSDLHQSAILYKLMVIGEASTHISERTKSRYSGVDWQSIKGFRNMIAHEYFSLDKDVIWDSANRNVVVLFQQVRRILQIEYPDFPLPEEWK